MLKILQYEKWYQHELVLKIADLNLPEGIHWIKGENGSGKTTLFASVAGLIPFKGDVYLHGISLKKDAVNYLMKVNFGEAEPQYPAWMSGLDLVNFVGRAKKADKMQQQDLIERFGIQHYLGKAVGTYSSGMVKKLSLLLSFLGQPTLILLDEPLITLDQTSTALMENLIMQYRTQGVSFLLSSHQDFGNATIQIDSTLLVKENNLCYGNHFQEQENPT